MAFRSPDAESIFNRKIRAGDLSDLEALALEDPNFPQRFDANYVGGIGNSTDPLAMVVGEAPGATEDLEREPFIGVSGQVLTQLMEMAGLYARPGVSAGSEDHPETQGMIEPNVWLTNSYKFRPDSRNRTPSAIELIAARPYLREEWRLVGKPKLIVCVGSVAATMFGISPIPNRGDIYNLKGDTYFCAQYHPAFGLRGGNDRKEMMERQWETMGEHIDEMIREGKL